MKRNHIKTYIILIIFIAIIGISITYAALQQQLQIKTSTTVQSSQSSWNISYQKQRECAIESGYVKLGTIAMNGTTITLSGFEFQAPNSFVSCYFNIINNGELDAKISSISGPNIVFTGSGSTKDTDEKLLQNHSNWFNSKNFCRWTTEDGHWPLEGWPVVKEGDKVSAGQTKYAILTFGTDDSMTALPTNPVTFSATYTINFEQA